MVPTTSELMEKLELSGNFKIVMDCEIVCVHEIQGCVPFRITLRMLFKLQLI